jgi:hypothetical protein
MIVEINGRSYWVASKTHEQQLRQRMDRSNEEFDAAKPKPPRRAAVNEFRKQGKRL